MNASNWKQFIEQEKSQPYYQKIIQSIQEDSQQSNIFPTKENIFKAFELTPLDQVKAVILGMDPFINQGQAHGLCFSSLIDIPPSLKNIYKELHEDIGFTIPSHGNLTTWAQRGALLLNSAMTVIEGKSGSHSNIGWHIFTDRAIELLNQQDRPIVFIFWGAAAKKKIPLITNNKHSVLCGNHPSPLSAHTGFFGGKYFSKANQFLINNNIQPIDWSL